MVPSGRPSDMLQAGRLSMSSVAFHTVLEAGGPRPSSVSQGGGPLSWPRDVHPPTGASHGGEVELWRLLFIYLFILKICLR